MSFTPQTVSPEEQEQILQTIEMFEVIIQASPQDCQSMEILKDAYLRVGRTADALAMGRRLADTYVEQGQISQAMYEYEAILQRDPTNTEVIAALSELEERLNRQQTEAAAAAAPVAAVSGALQPSAEMLDSSEVEVEFPVMVSDGGTLIITDKTRQAGGMSRPKPITPDQPAYSNEGNEALAKFLIHQKLAPEEVVNSALERVGKKNAERHEGTIPVSLIDEICRRGSVELETLLCGIIDRAKFAYIPLEYYDVDRAVVRMLPEHLTIGRLIVPFDVVSRTIMIATANPFDAEAKETAQQMLDYHIQWHLAAPQAISKALASVYKIGSAAPETLAFRISA